MGVSLSLKASLSTFILGDVSNFIGGILSFVWKKKKYKNTIFAQDKPKPDKFLLCTAYESKLALKKCFLK